MKLTPLSIFLSLLISLAPLQGQQSTSVAGVVGASTITIYRVVDYAAGASTLIPHVGTGGIVGISAIGGTTGQTIQFIPNGQAVCDFSAIPTVGNLVTVSGDRCTDAGTTDISTLSESVGVIGLTLSLQGSLCTNCALVSLYGPARFGNSLPDTGVTPGTYGSATAVPVLGIDAKGRTTTATPATITPAGIGAVPTTEVSTAPAALQIPRLDASGNLVIGSSALRITGPEGATPSSPAAGNLTLFYDVADGHVKRINSSGTVVDLEAGGSGGSPGGSGTEIQYRAGASTFGALETAYDSTNKLITFAQTAPSGNLTASTEASNILFNGSATRTWSTGALTNQREFRWLAPTYAFVGASTLTNAATKYISGMPVQGTNATITNSHALWIDGLPSASRMQLLKLCDTAIASPVAGGTLFGGNCSSFSGRLVELQVNGASQLRVDNTGNVTAGGSYIQGSTQLTDGTMNRTSGVFTVTNTQAGTSANYGLRATRGNAVTATSGDSGSFQTLASHAPTSGTGTYSGILVNDTFNQTSTATGVARGLYVSPAAVTSVYDLRLFETSGPTVNILSGSPIQNAVVFNAPTYAAAAGKTLATAATVYIPLAPIAGTNVTLTNSYALWAGGATRFDGTTTVNGVLDASAATSTQPNKTGTTPPATCSVGQTFFDTDATAGSNSLGCTATNTWTTQGGGSGSPSDVVLTPVAFASIPSAATAGRLQYFTDAPFVARDTGAAWDYWCGTSPCTPAGLTTFGTAVNAGSSTLTTAGGVHAIDGAATAGSSYAAWYKSVPSAPYTAIFKLQMYLEKAAYSTCAVSLRESGSGKVVAVNFQADSASTYITEIGKLNSPTSFSANYTISPKPGYGFETVWIKINDNNTDRIISLSPNGITWIQIHSVSRTDWITPDQIGIGYDSGSSNKKGFCVYESYRES